MNGKITVNKRDILSLMNSINSLLKQVTDEKSANKAINAFWSKKYSFIKAVILDCEDMNELNFIKRNIKENQLTEESLMTYKKRKKLRLKNNKENME